MFTLKHIFRTIRKFKYFSGLNILGLSLGLTCVILISIWIFNELGYDKFHEHHENIYQINYKTPEGERSAGSPTPLAPAIREEVAGIKNTARLRQLPELAFKYEDKMFYEDKLSFYI
jgi:putative ABC transport system permease protein